MHGVNLRRWNKLTILASRLCKFHKRRHPLSFGILNALQLTQPHAGCYHTHDAVKCPRQFQRHLFMSTKRAIIRQGDKTNHGGTVLEGFPTATLYGKPIAGKGHKVHCPKCRGTFEIAEGVGNHGFYEVNTAVEGMRTTCGAVLLASQHTTTIELAAGTGESVSPEVATQASEATLVSNAEAGDHADLFDEQVLLQGEAASTEGLPYFIVTKDGRTWSGRVESDGLLPRIATLGEKNYTVWWGDEALAQLEESGT